MCCWLLPCRHVDESVVTPEACADSNPAGKLPRVDAAGSLQLTATLSGAALRPLRSAGTLVAALALSVPAAAFAVWRTRRRRRGVPKQPATAVTEQEMAALLPLAPSVDGNLTPHRMRALPPGQRAAAVRAEMGSTNRCVLTLQPVADLPAGLLHRLASKSFRGRQRLSIGADPAIKQRDWQWVALDGQLPDAGWHSTDGLVPTSSSTAAAAGLECGAAVNERVWGLESRSLQLRSGELEVRADGGWRFVVFGAAGASRELETLGLWLMCLPLCLCLCLCSCYCCKCSLSLMPMGSLWSSAKGPTARWSSAVLVAWRWQLRLGVLP